ncbi:MAG: hypothetical protein AB8B89_09765 [Gammaproteobacteria bacterium]
MYKFKSNLLAMSAIVATSTFVTHIAVAEENPFKMTELSTGYMVADSDGKFCKKKMKKMDVNEDGSVSKDEFMSHAEKKFSKKDKNGDGVLTEDEMKRMKKHGEGKCGEGKCGEKKSDS